MAVNCICVTILYATNVFTCVCSHTKRFKVQQRYMESCDIKSGSVATTLRLAHNYYSQTSTQLLLSD